MTLPLRSRSRPTPAGYLDLEIQVALPHLDGVRVIDVREPHEFTDAHIPNAELVPLGTVPTAARAWDRDQPLVVVCRSGGRSGRAAQLLVQDGFREVYNLVGGMLQWSSQRLPTLSGHAQARLGAEA